MIPTLYDTFKHWSAKGSVYIMSDPHFNDEDCKIMSSNWIQPEEQVAIINKLAHKNDTLVFLGDIGDLSYVKQLKAGHKVLIMGNHDEGATKFKREIVKKVFDSERYLKGEVYEIMKKTYPDAEIRIEESNAQIELYPRWIASADNKLFDEVYEGPLFIAEKILLSHEPIFGLDFCFNIHGHDHSCKFKGDAYHLNLAANVCGFTPVSLGDIIKNGKISKVKTIHREIIDRATKNSLRRKNKCNK